MNSKAADDPDFQKEEFRTLNGYRRQRISRMTESMEDYLEMIFRMTAMSDRNNEADISKSQAAVGVNEIASLLHVRPSSASKMTGKLREQGWVTFEKYGQIRLTEQGRERGAYLLWRHNVLSEFFRRLNHSEGELRQVEQIEHFMDEQTIQNLEKLIPLLP